MKLTSAHTPSRLRPRLVTLLTAVVVAFTTMPQAAQTADSAPASTRKDKQRLPFPPPPPAPALREAALPPDARQALSEVMPFLRERRFPSAAVKRIGTAGDARLGWVLYDLLRFADRDTVGDVVAAFEKLTGAPLPAEPFTAMGDGRSPARLGLAGTAGLPRTQA